MNIIEIDVDSYAARVAYVAACEFYALMTEQPGHLFFGGLSEEVIAGEAVWATDFILREKIDKGETVWRWLVDMRVFNRPWSATTQEERLAFDLFVYTLRELRTRLSIIQIEAERKASLPPPNPAPAIEDTIFEPVGSMAEMEPWAAEAAMGAAKYDKAREEALAQKMRDVERVKQEDERASRQGEKGGDAADGKALSAGQAAPVGGGKDLPPVPNKPRRGSRGGRRKTPAKG